MPSANIDFMRDYWRVWETEGVAGTLARYDEFYTEDLHWYPPVATVSRTHYEGRDGYVRYLADVQELMGDIRASLVEAVEIAPDVVRVTVDMRAVSGRASGASVEARMVGVARFRDGRICWAGGSYDASEAERIAEAVLRGEEARI